MHVFIYRFRQGVLRYDIIVLADSQEQAEKLMRERGVDADYIKTVEPERRPIAPGVIYTS
ncbi:hypothetical protein HZC53_03195 [Candidatus Uhrbacteria bacterium]|nr:hypothetical protein [Candidatus Uhrbacteria bacterium]